MRMTCCECLKHCALNTEYDFRNQRPLMDEHSHGDGEYEGKGKGKGKGDNFNDSDGDDGDDGNGESRPLRTPMCVTSRFIVGGLRHSHVWS